MSDKINPFRPWAPVPPGIFAGRIKELMQIEKSLYQTINDKSQNILIYGERAIGKTSIALYTKYIAGGELETFNNEKLNILTISVSAKSKQTFEDLLLDIIFYAKNRLSSDQAFTKAIQSIWNNLDEVSLGSLVSFKKAIQKNGVSLSSDEFCYFLENLWDKIKDKYAGLLILLDEVDRVQDFSGVASFLKSIFEKLNFDGYNRIMFLICGMPEIREKLYNDHPSVLRNFEPIFLKPMPGKEAAQVIERALSGTSIAIKPEAVDLIVKTTQGYPHFLQEVGYSAFEVNIDGIIDEEDVRLGIVGTAFYEGSIARLGKQYFDKMYKEDIQSDVYREILSIIAKEKSHFVSRQTILNNFSKGKTVLGGYLKNLVDRGILIKDKSKLGSYALPSLMFKIYVNMASTFIKVENKVPEK